jgi:hypothetical protein
MPNPLGGTTELPDGADDDSISLADGAVVFRATLDAGAVAKLCLLSVTP